MAADPLSGRETRCVNAPTGPPVRTPRVTRRSAWSTPDASPTGPTAGSAAGRSCPHSSGNVRRSGSRRSRRRTCTHRCRSARARWAAVDRNRNTRSSGEARASRQSSAARREDPWARFDRVTNRVDDPVAGGRRASTQGWPPGRRPPSGAARSPARRTPAEAREHLMNQIASAAGVDHVPSRSCPLRHSSATSRWVANQTSGKLAI